MTVYFIMRSPKSSSQFLPTHMDIHYSPFDDITPLQKYLPTIIFDTSASLSIYLHKIDFVGPINPLL